jgi:hypothetical protein
VRHGHAHAAAVVASMDQKHGKHMSDTDAEQHDAYQLDDLDEFGNIFLKGKNADSERCSSLRSEGT